MPCDNKNDQSKSQAVQPEQSKSKDPKSEDPKSKDPKANDPKGGDKKRSLADDPYWPHVLYVSQNAN